MMDYYALLGISRDADETTVSSACSAMLKANHPDRTGTEATGHVVSLVRDARRVLTDPAARAAHDAALDAPTTPPPPPPAPVAALDSMTAVFQAYLAFKIVSRISAQHDRHVASGPGTIAVDPVSLVFGASASDGPVSWTIPAGSRPGDRVEVVSGGTVIDTPTLTLAPMSEGRYWADGMMWELVFAEPAQLASGGHFTLTGDELDLVIPPASQAVTVISNPGWNALVLDKRITPYLEDTDTIEATRRILEG